MDNINDFSQGKVSKNILKLAVPMIIAQLINVLYSIVDRMYIGHLPDASANALTGIGLTFPIISIVIAFANLFGMGGTPLFSIERGRNDNKKAKEIMDNSFSMLIITGTLITIVILIFKNKLLYLFGASDITFPYADSYITIYIYGSIFVMIGLGMNNFINAQGFGQKGMLTITIGAIINIILDPIFIILLDMGVKGAALATIISQFISALWAILFLTGNKALIKLKILNFKLNIKIIKKIIVLGMSGFIMSITNSAVQIVCNTTLQAYGGDLYVGVMTIINSIREIIIAPVNGLTSATQPILGFNYGAKKYKRVLYGIKFMSIICVIYSIIAWLLIFLFPKLFIQVFNNEPELIDIAIPSIHIYFFGIFMMSLQMSGQSAALALGKSKQAIFFSLLRKAIIVIPLTIILPRLFNLNVNGVFLAEPISNFIGGGACFITMLLTILKELKYSESKVTI